ncbi:MAG TPA: carbamoyl-phosphate synthase large subunit, partial [Planctomycetota bacterium]|nr:carbamoyl-phosphate synthase large subunit [Planctomycetota bacterium]
MPRRDDLHKILIIGSGPIIIGQACEFDYSGTQACKALREEGYEVVLLNSNPATIMTDPEMSDRTYIEPVTPEVLARVIEVERPDALLPTLGGQTGLNTAIAVFEAGVLEKFGVEMIGASAEAIRKAEDRELFAEAMRRIGLDLPRSGIARSPDEARRVRDVLGFPCVIRPAFTLGGKGGGIAYNVDEFEDIVAQGLDLSMIHEVLVEESLLGWKEFELEVMRDRADNVVIICSIENFDPMGIHTGDSITVAPAQTLTDKEYQRMRDAAIAIIREIGVDTGGSNIQFAVHPDTGRMVVIEMNPRVSRSSALASKATGFPIARFAAKLAVGYTLDEIPNDITRETPASFEPTIDYCVVKTPRWTFEKFPDTDPHLTTRMKSVGEAMSIGRTFKEALQKALRSLEIGRFGLGCDRTDAVMNGTLPPLDAIRRELARPTDKRIFYLRYALKAGMTAREIHELTGIDPWFLDNVAEIVEFEEDLAKVGSLEKLDDATLREAKRLGFSDEQLSRLLGVSQNDVRRRRKAAGIEPTYKLVDTCAAEFEAYTPYYYSTWEEEDESRPQVKPRVMILGGGPNRIGQGIEFDYCCVQACFALRELGYETVMVNSNPETVSTDYDTSDHLFFEPLTHEDVLNICERTRPEGVIVQLGGQTPLNLAEGLEAAGVKILGTPPAAIARAEDREQFKQLLERVGLRQPPNGTAFTMDEAVAAAHRIGYPVVVRPSFVLGGRAMEIANSDVDLRRFMQLAAEISPEHPVLIDGFLQEAIEVDVDAVSDGATTVVAGVLEHIEEAGVHSGDSSMVIPPHSLEQAMVEEIKEATRALAREVGVVGLMNVQYAVKDGVLFVLEVNPRASRTVPFVSKATGVPYARIAAQVMTGKTLAELGVTREVEPRHVAVKASVFPFERFPGSDIILGPEMRSTGEVMGIDRRLGPALAKAMIAAGLSLPTEGTVFISVRDSDKPFVPSLARRLVDLGFRLISTSGTWEALRATGIHAERIAKIQEGSRPNILDKMKNREVQLVINTPSIKGPGTDEARIRGFTVT